MHTLTAKVLVAGCLAAGVAAAQQTQECKQQNQNRKQVTPAVELFGRIPLLSQVFQQAQGNQAKPGKTPWITSAKLHTSMPFHSSTTFPKSLFQGKFTTLKKAPSGGWVKEEGNPFYVFGTQGNKPTKKAKRSKAKKQTRQKTDRVATYIRMLETDKKARANFEKVLEAWQKSQAKGKATSFPFRVVTPTTLKGHYVPGYPPQWVQPRKPAKPAKPAKPKKPAKQSKPGGAWLNYKLAPNQLWSGSPRAHVMQMPGTQFSPGTQFWTTTTKPTSANHTHADLRKEIDALRKEVREIRSMIEDLRRSAHRRRMN